MVASIMPGKVAGSSQQQQQQQASLSTLALVQQALAKQSSQLGLQLGGGGHEGKGTTTQLSLDAAQLLSQLMAARGGVTAGLAGLSSFTASIAGAGANAGGIGASAGGVGVTAGGVSASTVGVSGRSGVSANVGVGAASGGGVVPQHNWLTESEEEGVPVGDVDDDWDDSESD